MRPAHGSVLAWILALLVMAAACKKEAPAPAVEAASRVEAPAALLEATLEAEPTPDPKPSYYGSVSIRSDDELQAQKGRKADAPRGKVKAAEGKRWVMAYFPETEHWTEAQRLKAVFFRLDLEDGSKIWTGAIPTDFCNSPEQRRQRQPLHFAIGYGDNEFTPSMNYPVAVAFEVPRDARNGLLRVSDKALEVQW